VNKDNGVSEGSSNGINLEQMPSLCLSLAVSHTHTHTQEKIKVCDGGKGSGQICGGEKICPRTSSNETVECVVKWEESEPISRV